MESGPGGTHGGGVKEDGTLAELAEINAVNKENYVEDRSLLALAQPAADNPGPHVAEPASTLARLKNNSPERKPTCGKLMIAAPINFSFAFL